MTSDAPDFPSAPDGATSAGRTSAASGPVRPYFETAAANSAMQVKPRVRMLETDSDLTPAGATFSTPVPTPLPERRAGLYLLLSLTAAAITLVFVVLLYLKL